jgi:hypothetical protein
LAVGFLAIDKAGVIWFRCLLKTIHVFSGVDLLQIFLLHVFLNAIVLNFLCFQTQEIAVNVSLLLRFCNYCL